MEENEKMPIILDWLGHEGLRFVQTLTDNEQEKFKVSSDLFTLSEKFKPQHNETILSLQYCKLIKEEKTIVLRNGWVT